MTHTELLNMSLYRPLRDEYPEDIFPQVPCRSTDLGEGDTFFSVQQMATLINSYYKQCSKIAKLLKSESLEKTTKAVHHFSYWHYQYKADDLLQQLRSPACAWKQRKQGIDCKSYSIVVGSILKCLGIGFYIRQIKQANSLYPDQFSHVYIVVPKDQKKYKIKKNTDYYVIDGTIPTMNEIQYLDKSDYLIPAMKHIALNGSYLIQGLKATPPSYQYQPEFNFNSGQSSPASGGSKFLTHFNNGVSALEKLITLYGNFEAAKRGINRQAGNQIVPSHIQNQEQFLQYLQQQSSENQQMMMSVISAVLQNKPEPKTDYTPYIIGGAVVVLGIVGVIVFSTKK